MTDSQEIIALREQLARLNAILVILARNRRQLRKTLEKAGAPASRPPDNEADL